MIVIGFRSFPDGFAYVVLEGTQGAPTVVEKERLVFPKNSNRCSALSWLRKQLSEIMQSFELKGACIKTI